jgi:hypothetical protein
MHVIDHSNGCKGLQKFLECCDQKDVVLLFEQLKPNLANLYVSLNENRIVKGFIDAVE